MTSDEREELDRLLLATQTLPLSDYLSFLKQTVPKGWTVDVPHIRLIAEHLDAVERGEIDRLAIHMPPRHGKSETTTIRYPVYSLSRRPDENVLLTGFNERFARRLGRKARTVAQGLAPGLLNLAADKYGTDEWAVKEGAVLMTRGVGSPPTGTGFGRIVIDDPIRKREDADSESAREKAWDWYTSDLYTRLQPGGAIIMVATRWHEDDVCARAVASEPNRWTVLKLPALAEADDILGRLPGEALWPDQWPLDALERTRAVLDQAQGKRAWEALYQQHPVPVEGALFKAAWLSHRYSSLPKLKDVCTIWDLALKAKEHNDETACITVGTGVDDGQLYVVRVRHGRWETPDVADFLVAQADWLKQLYGGEYRGDYVEDKVSGTTLMQFVKRQRPDLALIPISVEGDKVARAHGVTPLLEAGRVLFPNISAERSYISYLIEQLLAFPGGKHDDGVDVFVYSILRFMGRLNQRQSRRGKGGGFI